MAGFGCPPRVEYGAVILDLRLPDRSGLSMLDALRSDGNPIPVLVLTGYGDVESAVTAMRLGAVDFKRKPLIGDDLAAGVRGLLGYGRGFERVRSIPPTRSSASCPSPCEPARDELAPVVNSHPRPEELLRTMLRPGLTSAEFVVAARALHRLVAVDDGSRCLRVRRHAPDRCVADAPAIAHALGYLESKLVRGIVPNEAEVARESGVSPVELGLLLHAHTGAGFNEVRRTLRVRPALLPVISASEQIAQIAYRIGYEHPDQFNRDFRLTYGLPPGEFRSLFMRRIQLR